MLKTLKFIMLSGLLSGAVSACGASGDSEAEVISITIPDETTEVTDDDLDEPPTTDPADDVEPMPVAPVYDGQCPTFTEGVNSGFVSGGVGRTFRLELPENPQGAPVLFAWHWLGGSAATLVNVLQLSSLANDEGVIVIAPESNGAAYEWRFTEAAAGNQDLQLFEDLLGCAYQQYEVDLDRVYSTGHSAGGLWTSYLTIHASQWLAATAVMSGGATAGAYRTPDHKLPVLIIWGGPTDSYGGLSFAQTSTFFADALREDGHFVTTCEHTQGHLPPVGGMAYIWRWFEDHPRGVEEPYANGLPDVFPDYCQPPASATE